MPKSENISSSLNDIDISTRKMMKFLPSTSSSLMNISIKTSSSIGSTSKNRNEIKDNIFEKSSFRGKKYIDEKKFNQEYNKKIKNYNNICTSQIIPLSEVDNTYNKIKPKAIISKRSLNKTKENCKNKVERRNSLNVDCSDEIWFKNQMYDFINNLPNCETLYFSREVAFEWLDKYLNFLITKGSCNKKTSLKDVLSEDIIINIIHQSAALCEQEPMLLELNFKDENEEIVVMSDIHGSIADVIRAFLVYGLPGHKIYLFLGDYVDRGSEEVDVVMLLLLLKVCFPNSIFLLRGNHEFPDQNRKGDFPMACKKTFGSANYWKILNFVFNRFSLAAIIQDEIYCAHGGVSQWIKGRSSITNMKKPMDSNESLLDRLIISDIVWSDADRLKKIKDGFLFYPSTIRGIGYTYSEQGLLNILQLLKVKKMIRGHQPHLSGFHADFEDICYTVHARQLRYGNKGCVCKVYRHKENGKIIICAGNYTLESFFKTFECKNKAIKDIKMGFLNERGYFLKDNFYKYFIVKGKTKVFYDKMKIHEVYFPTNCYFCGHKNDFIEECSSRKRIFVTHYQIFLFMCEQKFFNLLKEDFTKSFNSIQSKILFCAEKFPVFLDCILTNLPRNSKLISILDIKDKESINKACKNVKLTINKQNNLLYKMLPNQYYYDALEFEKE